MVGFNFDRIQRRADSLIGRFGGSRGNGKLRRNGVDRKCTCVIIEFKPSERGLVTEGAKRALISRFDPDTGQPLALVPDPQLDLLVFAGDVHRIVAPDRGPRPNGVAVYHDMEVLYDSRDA